MTTRRRLILLVIFLSMTACASQQAAPPTEASLPTATHTEDAIATPQPTIAQRSTLPPTWTPVPQEVEATAEATNTPVPTPTLGQQSAAPAPALPDACDNFGPDLSQTPRTYRNGEDVTVYWNPVEGAAYYYIALTDQTAAVVHEDYVAETSYTFSADLFESGNLYGWQAHPVNSAGIQMCLAHGAELFPEF